MKISSCRLYLVTPPKLDPVPFAEDLAKALDAGDVACVQLRLKDADDETVRRAIDVLRPVAQSREVAFILNDRPDLAAQTGCDGAHVGQEDMPYEKARKLLGPQAIVGVTCHDSRHLAMEAAEKGADYVAFGAFFETTAKEPKGHSTPDILYWWNQIMTTPVVAIGGIFPHNLAPLVEAGADFVAGISAVFYNPDGPAAGVKAMNKAIAEAPQPANI